MNYCQNCGNELKPGVRFCGTCGKNINYTQPNFVPPNSFQDNTFSPLVSHPFGAGNQEFNKKNSQWRIVNLWLILMAVFIFLIFLPSIIGLEGMHGGFALSFVAGFLVIISLIVIFIYRSRAKILDKILSGQGRIAVWSYSPEEWGRFASFDFEEEKKAKKMLFYLISAICVVVGLILFLVVKDILIFFIALAIIPVVALPAFLGPRMRYQKLMKSEPKALIAETGVIVGKMFHLWVKLGARLDQVLLVTDEQPQILEFHYSIPTRNGRQEEVARIPVPYGMLEEAERIGQYLGLAEKLKQHFLATPIFRLLIDGYYI